jgi:hypothetical protein
LSPDDQYLYVRLSLFALCAGSRLLS